MKLMADKHLPTRYATVPGVNPPPINPSIDLIEVEHVAVEVREDVALEQLLLAVERELLGADGADLPVALHVLLEAALLEVGGENHLAQRAALVNVVTKETERVETL